MAVPHAAQEPSAHPAVLAWIRDVPDEQHYLSAVAIGEIQAGTEITTDDSEFF